MKLMIILFKKGCNNYIDNIAPTCLLLVLMKAIIESLKFIYFLPVTLDLDDVIGQENQIFSVMKTTNGTYI